jgi:hypothetical protein
MDIGFNMADVFEINALTGEVAERDFYEHEKFQVEQDILVKQEIEKQKVANEKKKEKARKSALDKLKELGLTPAELKELFGE